MRKGHRTHVGKILQEVQYLLDKYDEPYKFDLLGHKQTLEDKLGIIQDLDNKILEGLTEEVAITDEIVAAGEFPSKVQKCIYQIEGKLTENDRKPVVSSHNTTVQEAKVPKLQIKTFSGNIVEFQSFLDYFTAMVGSK